MLHHTYRGFSDHRLLTVVVAVIVTLLLFWWAPSAGADVAIDTCGQTVPAGETGYLVMDLDCARSGTEGVVLSHRSRLVLAGYVISGSGGERGDEDPRPLQGVRCAARTVCTVIGPGAIVGFSDAGVAGTRVRVRDVAIEGNARKGVAAFENIALHGVVVDGNGDLGVHAGGRLRMHDTDIAEHGQADVLEWRAPRHRPVRNHSQYREGRPG
jgi:hypothetical protein